jgi:hypothetical protein
VLPDFADAVDLAEGRHGPAIIVGPWISPPSLTGIGNSVETKNDQDALDARPRGVQ